MRGLSKNNREGVWEQEELIDIKMFQTKYNSLIEMMVSMQNFQEIVQIILQLLEEFDKFSNKQLVFTR